VPARSVSLTFSLPTRPDLGTPTLELTRRGADWTGRGTVLSMLGRWDVTVLVQESTTSTTIPLQLQTRLPPEQCTVSPGTGGQPTVYTITLPGRDTLQTYVDPAKAGPDNVHFTFFQPTGNELAIASAKGSELTSAGVTRPLELIRFDKGHFVANVKLTSGTWTFMIDSTAKDGTPFSGYFKQTIPSQGGASCT
jgi:hypothetical protein